MQNAQNYDSDYGHPKLRLGYQGLPFPNCGLEFYRIFKSGRIRIDSDPNSARFGSKLPNLDGFEDEFETFDRFPVGDFWKFLPDPTQSFTFDAFGILNI